MSSESFSGFLTNGTEGTDSANAKFCHFSDLPSRGYSRLVKASRDGRWWILKGLKEEFLGQNRYRVLLQKEYGILSAMSHPGIVEANSFETVEGIGPCIVMEWVDGETLGEWLKSERTKEQKRAVFAKLLDAVEYLHDRQTVHRDLKPSNVLITRNGENVKLIDFGLSDTDSHILFKHPAGTIGYISPEQLQENSTDARNDIYSLGCILRDLRLGFTMRRVVNHCCRPMAKRYANVEDLRRAFKHVSRIPLYIMALCFSVMLAVAVFSGGNRYSSKPSVSISDAPLIDNITYTLLSVKEKTVAVVKSEPIPDGRLVIPETVVFNDTVYRVKGIMKNAFANNLWMTSVEFPPSLKYIGEASFWNTNISTVTIPDSVMLIDRAAFANCKLLKKVVIGRALSATSIDIFNGTIAMQEIQIKAETPPVMEDQSDFRYDEVKLRVPAASVEQYKNAPEWKRFKNIEAY